MLKIGALVPAFSRFSRYFLEVARAGSVRRAAENLHVSASAVDRQLLLAEAELKTELFERLPTGLKVTAAGELLFHDLQRWQKDFMRTTEQIDELQGLRRGHVSIALIDALSVGALPKAFADIAARHPRLSFELSVLKSGQVADAVKNMEADFGLLLEPDERAGLEIKAQLEVPIGVVVPSSHPWASKPSVRYSALDGERQIISAAPLIVARRIQALAARHGPHLSPVVVCNDIRTMLSLVRAGAGIGLISKLDASVAPENEGLSFIPFTGHHVRPLTLALCVAPRRQLSRAALMCLEALTCSLMEGA